MAGVRILFDTSVLVSGLLEIHENHRDSAAALDSVHGGRSRGVVATHALAETWSTLSGLPVRPPLDPGEVHRLIETVIVGRFEVVPLDAEDYLAVLGEMTRGGFRGRIVYDALHVRAARKTGADEILTYNVRHFRRLAPDLAGRIRRP